jgi:hypothetical protein
MKRSALIILCAVAAACADDVPEGSFIERTRILGVGAEPAGDAERAWPRAGEETTLRWLVAAPGALPPLSWRVAVCSGEIAACATSPMLVAEGQGMPEVRFVAPDAERVWVVAEVSPEGEPATALTFELPVEKTEANHHPRAAALRFAGAEWTEDSCPEGRAGGDAVELTAITAGADRETYTDPEGATRREGLRLSFFTTAGELEGQYRVVERDDPADVPESHTGWTPPEAADVPDGGLEAHFTVVVRDLRGGISWTTRRACVRK